MVLEQLLPNAPAEQDPTDPYPIGTDDGENTGSDHDPGNVVDDPSNPTEPTNGDDTGDDNHDAGNTTDDPFTPDPSDDDDDEDDDDFGDLDF